MRNYDGEDYDHDADNDNGISIGVLLFYLFFIR